MKFKDLPVGNYFTFVRKDNDGAVVLQKLGQFKFRYANGTGITPYCRNETVEDLGGEYKKPEFVKFNKLEVGNYFVFRERRTIYQKESKYYIRQFGIDDSTYYNKNEDVQNLSKDSD